MRSVILFFVLFSVAPVFGATRTIDADVIRRPTTLNLLTLPTGPDTITGNATTATLTNKSMSGATNTFTLIPGSAIDPAAAIARSKLASGTAYRILANDATGVMSENAALTASRVIVSDANGQLGVSTVTDSTLLFLDATSSVQTQLNGKQATLVPGAISTTTTGVTVGSGAASTVGPNVTVDIQTATGAQPGLLSAADFTTFNGKQAAGSYITALTGDVTAAGPGSSAATLATVNGDVGSFGSSTSIPSFTVNAKGLITAASGNVVVAPAGTLTGVTLAANVVSSSLTSVGTIGTGVWQGSVVGTAYGGRGTETQEVPSGTVNSANTGFTLAFTPVTAGSVELFLDGVLQRQPTDYSVSGTAITFVTAPDTGQSIYSVYVR